MSSDTLININEWREGLAGMVNNEGLGVGDDIKCYQHQLHLFPIILSKSRKQRITYR